LRLGDAFFGNVEICLFKEGIILKDRQSGLLQRKTVRIFLAIIVVLWIPPILYYIHTAIKLREYMQPFEEQAIEYIKAQPDVIEKFGENLELECIHRVIIEKDEDDTYSSAEDFERKIEALEIYLSANNEANCVVVFRKNSENRLVISDYFWE